MNQRTKRLFVEVRGWGRPRWAEKFRRLVGRTIHCPISGTRESGDCREVLFRFEKSNAESAARIVRKVSHALSRAAPGPGGGWSVGVARLEAEVSQ